MAVKRSNMWWWCSFGKYLLAAMLIALSTFSQFANTNATLCEPSRKVPSFSSSVDSCVAKLALRSRRARRFSSSARFAAILVCRSDCEWECEWDGWRSPEDEDVVLPGFPCEGYMFVSRCVW